MPDAEAGLFLSLAADVANSTTNTCPNGTDWVWKYFGECVTTEEHFAAFLIGLISIGLWLIPLFPQIYENYKRKNCEGLSIYFLLFWMVGDVTNFIGAVFTSQMPTQIYVAVYYIIQDLILFSQFIYYTYVLPRWNVRATTNRLSGASVGSPTGYTSLRVFGLLLILGAGVTFAQLVSVQNQVDQYGVSGFFAVNAVSEEEFVRPGSRRLLRNFFNGAKDEVGYALGSISAVSYLSGRIPQVLTNYWRADTKGLSLPMFVIIVFGNIAYGLSVLLAGEGGEFILRHLPWLVGSLGCCTFDTVVIVQIFYYTYKNSPVSESDDEKEDLVGLLDDNDDEIVDI